MLTITDTTPAGIATTFADVLPSGTFKIGAKNYQKGANGTAVWCFDDAATTNFSGSQPVFLRDDTLTVSTP